jgi:hypothetical protein
MLVLAMPIAAWWVIGDQSEPIDDPDYAFRPLDISSGTERAFGAVALVLVAGSVIVILISARRGRFDASWWRVLAPLIAAGAICGYGWRIMTAGVGGANIGAGFVLFFGAPIVLALTGWAAVNWIRLQRIKTGARH